MKLIQILGAFLDSGSGNLSNRVRPNNLGTCLGLRDLFFDTRKKGVRKIKTKLGVGITLIEARNIAPTKDLIVIDYNVKIGLYDKNSVIGNVSNIPAYVKNTSSTWRFQSEKVYRRLCNVMFRGTFYSQKMTITLL